ncbi:phosphohistidine phosphatase SixA [Vibrio sinensis]|uniref:Phosphohistidine phosphatase SixA n=1 Tax=Vibrio sinensis TaxID=2302434 RepID=A0A3A6QMG9_9VIBR|nr:phosphohistidine phosphatase SixA [Vibrio sinensis]RJX73825.1 phosphohistidine phosphatase SixA [Vibrio sinensis]
MKLMIMRHGEAEHYAASDAERALTQNGRTTSVAVARACNEQGIIEIDKVLVSPYLRAQQTWQEISGCFKAQAVETSEDITPYGESEQLFEYLSARIELENIESLLLVSHLPLVGYLTAEFVKDIAPPMFPTSGMICIDYDPISRSGEILWNVHS